MKRMPRHAVLAAAQLNGYTHVRVLPTGQVAGLRRFIFTTGLCVDLDVISHRSRFCFKDHGAAEIALKDWDGIGDPPGPWLKEKGLSVDRHNPLTFKGIPVRAEG